MALAHTSREAYDKILESLGDRQTIVYEALKVLGQASNEEIADHLGWPINRVTGRISELCNKFDIVAVIGVTKNKSGFSAKLFAPKDINDKKLLEMDCE